MKLGHLVGGSCKAALALAWLTLEASTPAVAAPSNKLVTGNLVSPADAWAFYGASSAHTNGFQTWTPVKTAIPRPEIHVLAVSLGSERLSAADYAERVLQYISNNIAVEYRFGLGKGGYGALIDQSGTPFDQADLMVLLLRDAGISATYQVGTIAPNVGDFGKWTGLVKNLDQANQSFTVSAKAACQMLADGGIPATVNGASSCTGLSGDLTSITIGHIWVAANGKIYDPSFKQHVLKAGIGIPSAMGCGTSCGSQAASALLQGATSGNLNSDARFPYLQNLNAAAIDATLLASATNLEATIKNSDQLARLEDVTGGKSIDTTTYRLSGTTSSFNAATQYSWAGDVPDQFRTKVNISCPPTSTLYNMFADEIAGQVVAAKEFNVPNEFLIQVCTDYNRPTAQFSIDHPYAAAGGAYADRANLTQDLLYPYYVQGSWGSGSTTDSPTGFAFVVQIGNATPSTVQYYGRFAERTPAANAYVADIGVVATAAKALGNRALGRTVLEGVANKIIISHASIGVALNTLKSGRLSLQSSESVESKNDVVSDNAAVFEVSSLLGSSLEGQVLTDGLEQGAAPSAFAIANKVAAKFVSVDAANVAALTSSLSSYSTEQKARLSAAGNGGMNFIVPQDGNTGGYFCQFVTESCLGTAPAYGFNASESAPLVAMYFKGGTGALVDPEKSITDTLKASEKASGRPGFATNLAQSTISISPAPDLVTGGLAFQRYYDSSRSENAYFRIGSQSILGVWRINGTDIGGSWQHNLRPTASIGSDTDAALGKFSALQGSAAIVAVQTMLQTSALNTASGRMAAMFSSHWLMTQFFDNAVTFTIPPEQPTFFKLPSGAYFNRAMDGSLVSVTGSRTGPYASPSCPTGGCYMNTGYRYSNVTLQYTAKDGVVWNFSPTSTSSSIVPAEFFGDSSTSPNGFRKTFDYIVPSGETARRPSSVRTSDGHRIDFTFENPPAADADYISSGTWYLKQISDENGRVVSFTRSDCVYFTIPSIGSRCSGPYRQIAVSQVDGGVLKYEYAPDANSSEPAMPKSNSFRMRRVFLPSSPTLPYLTLKYDDLSRIKSVVTPTATTSYLGSGIVGSDRAFGLTVDGLNSVSKSIIGPSAQVVAMQDALGRSTSSVYDNAGRLLRTVYAEGNAVEYSYDVRGNRLTECQIPKGRVSWATLTALTEQVPQCNVAAGDLRTTTTYMEGPTVQANLCGNPKTCNSPLSKIDAKGNQTDFTWSSVHGQILTETRPADGNGVRPVTTYGYTAYTGTDGATFYLLTSKQEKIDASNSTTTAYEYDASNHWVLKSLVTDSGGLALRTCFKFDAIGNLISKTEPRAGLASCP